jgi:ATP-binding cassette subfamily B protein
MNRKDLALLRRLLGKIRPYWTKLAGILLLGLLSTPLALLTPLPLKLVVDNVIGSQPLPPLLVSLLPQTIATSNSAMIAFATGLIIAIALLSQLLELGSNFLSAYTAEKLVLDFQTQLFGHVQRLSLLYHDTRGTSDSTYRIQYDTSAIRYIAIDGIIPFITASFTLASMLYVTFRLDRQLALIALGVSPILFTIIFVYRRRLRYQSRRIKKFESATLSVVQEVLVGLRLVKAFGQEEREQERFAHRSGEGVQARLHLSLVEGGLGLLLGLTTATGTAAVLFIGIRNVQAGTLTLGELLLIMGYLTQLYGPLKVISKKVASLQSHFASAERAFALLDEVEDVVERPGARQLSRATGEVIFGEVCFAYEPDYPILHNISFEAPAGTRVGIAGVTGAGKTTLMSLLTRFYDPTSGQIVLDGVDLRDYKLADLRDQFAIVLQEPVLFSASIAENIAYGRLDASDEEITVAAKAANAHDFIISLPDGYETQVGERGMRLSGGERQRIALARAFLKDAPILILDEPTSSVDLKTESGILEAMERLMIGRTCFTIAHRLNTLRNCDLLLVLEHGQLIDVITNVSEALEHPPDAGNLESVFHEVNVDG